MAMPTRAAASLPAHGPRESGRPLQSWGQRLAIVAAGLLLAWFSLAVTLGQVVGTRRPGLVLRLGIDSATAKAAIAATLTKPGATGAEIAQANRLSREALRREPVNMIAARTQAQLAALRNDRPAADKWFFYAERLSRRDLMTQLWLLEREVGRGNVTGALTHYDRALRVTRNARATLFPVLITASDDPVIADALVPVLKRRPGWALDFVEVMTESPQASARALATLAGRLGLDPASPVERTTLQKAINRLVTDKQFQEASRLARTRQAVGVADGVYNGDFERLPVLTPFDWMLIDGGEQSATIEPRGSGSALSLRTPHGSAGELARQLLLLEPGRHVITVGATGLGGAQSRGAELTLSCVDGPVIQKMPLTTASFTRLRAPALVPIDCPAQWLIIAAPLGLGDADQTLMLDDIDIRPALPPSRGQ